MKGIRLSPPPTQTTNTIQLQSFPTTSTNPNQVQFLPFQSKHNNKKKKTKAPILCLSSTNPSKIHPQPPLVVVGSANADIYVEIDRLPKEGETVPAKTGQTLAGGKGANQAACGGKLSYPTYFVGQVGQDSYGKLVTEALRSGGVCLDHVTTISGGTPTGHAVVMLQSDGQNSIIVVGGANMSCWPEILPQHDLDVVRNAGIVLLQREIPDAVNIQVAKAARSAGVPVIFDAGGMDSPIPQELLNCVDILSPNETELGRLTGMPTESFEDIAQAAAKCHKWGVKQVLVKLGEKGSALFIEGEEPIQQPAIFAKKVLDTTGAGDTFTAAFAVALVEGKSKKECLKFAAAAASLCVQVKGAIPSMPDRKSVLELLNYH
ncbi:ribokinase-like [Arachis stenosperma]|uniref:ribokinase-like n=1 Tax=Arachis stenosperma TaxID=217475 RepID=UPI0025AC4097|nr:ribokinase-like [Arachis stenosperma]